MSNTNSQSVTLGSVLLDPDHVGESEHRSVVETIVAALDLPEYEPQYQLSPEEVELVEAVLLQFQETCAQALNTLRRGNQNIDSEEKVLSNSNSSIGT